MKLTALAGLLAASLMLAFAAPAAAQTTVHGPYNLLTANGILIWDIAANDYDLERIDLLGVKEIEKRTDGTVPTVSKGKTLTNGNGGTTSIGERAIPGALCDKYTAKFGADDPRAMDYCDGVVRVAITSGAAQSSHYNGDVHGTAAICEVSNKTRETTRILGNNSTIVQVESIEPNAC
jgi:hypothetical protein